MRSTEGEGDRVGTQRVTQQVERGDPIALTLGALRLDLSRAAGEVYEAGEVYGGHGLAIGRARRYLPASLTFSTG